jgi:probable rRNA maturation factor
MTYRINIQHIADKAFAPKASLMRKWASAALSRKIAEAEITLRLVDTEEMTALNATYRHKKGPTNVLSFPFSIPDAIPMDIPFIGDIVICTDVVNREASEQGKEPAAHWAHMIVHGIFHLLGYDHTSDEEAIVMESLEIETLKTLGFPNPYLTGEDNTYHG